MIEYAWELSPALGLRADSCVLEPGCGPGLYAERLARRGIEVLGIAHREPSGGAADIALVRRDLADGGDSA
ncbi:hypothetical protein ASG92_26220 [Arthrobacter sp. Soil736]|uniref:hypothetical protein n=1 Tax=Arthrobacter sp. Soil736 TaxID=1736395 RepID=UPI0006FF6AF5|nr:hypothetical protein [Arthrobacter sp. Soil736]KRE50922.1 hypothetical protein ASG92_26220 [Arthrobacter sp. Soil736]